MGTQKLIITVVAGILAVGGMSAGLTGCSTTTLDKPPASTTDETPVTDPAPAEEPAEPAEPALTLAQQNAVGKAESYLAMSGFSRAGLIKQLEFEKFPTADAEFAVDHIAPDWNAEAAEKAKSYLDMSAFSRDALLKQLLFEGFTQAEAEAGLAAVGY